MADSNYNKLVAQILGAVLVLVGVLGFALPNPLLGLFGVNLLHNLVHLLTGGVLLAAAFMDGGRNARLVNIILGVVYLLVAVVGFLGIDAINALVGNASTDPGVALADPALHLLLAVVLLGVAFTMKETTMTTSRTM